MRRLYLQVYLALVGILILFGVLASVAFWGLGGGQRDEFGESTAILLHEALPGPERPAAELEEALARLGERLRLDLSVHGADATPLAAFGRPLPAPRPGHTGSRWLRSQHGPVAVLRLPDGRLVVARRSGEHPSHPSHVAGVLLTLGLLGGAVALGAYPVARRLTRRLERLRQRVDDLGAGELSARVEVEGKDEVAELARRFNRAADRIERLVEGQRRILASASHELRSPLARLRVAVELLAGEARPELRVRASQDIAELDELIGELLLASQLDTLEGLERREPVDLLALLAEEGARAGAEVGGAPARIDGDPRMLRRMLRNLLENARRYGGGTSIEASVAPLDAAGGARVRVADRGPGVPAEERERIFEPFYRAPGSREGTGGGVGLGLALVRQIARHHGGDARCQPREGGGTLFEVELPA
jgi:signal transduction histidine kinase